MEQGRAERETRYIDRLKRSSETIKIVLTLNFMSIIKERGRGQREERLK